MLLILLQLWILSCSCWMEELCSILWRHWTSSGRIKTTLLSLLPLGTFPGFHLYLWLLFSPAGLCAVVAYSLSQLKFQLNCCIDACGFRFLVSVCVCVCWNVPAALPSSTELSKIRFTFVSIWCLSSVFPLSMEGLLPLASALRGKAAQVVL